MPGFLEMDGGLSKYVRKLCVKAFPDYIYLAYNFFTNTQFRGNIFYQLS